ncbi:MAG: ABC transporter substrate-binding protein [Dehalococcoidia bacterium]|nr:ABC transporter substrate-binding protein [Dehalococcoidia bacterium]
MIPRRHLSKVLLLVAGAIALTAAACGGSESTPVPVQPTAAPAPKATAVPATAAPAPTATNVPATAVPAPTNTPKPAGPAGSLVIARQNVGIPVGIPEACVPGCENEKFRMGVTENLFFTDKDGNVIPRLGLSWKLAPDTSTLDIVLQKGVQFHNGYGEMTAEDVAWTFQNANPTTNPKSVNDQAGEWRTMLKSVEVLDQYTVRMNINTWQAHAIRHYLTPYYQSIGMHSKKAFDKLGADAMKADFTGTGPYRMVSWVKDDKAVLEALPAHWRKVAGVKDIRVISVPDITVRLSMLETGEADITTVAVKDVPNLEKKGFTKVLGRSVSNTTFFGGNYWEKARADTKEELKNPGYDLSGAKPWIGNIDNQVDFDRAVKVRKAMALVIDRETINKTILKGLAKPNYIHGLSVDNPVHKKEWVIPYDTAQAKALFAETGTKPFKIQIWTSTGDLAEIAAAIAAAWKENLGIDVEISTIEYAAHRPSLVAREWNNVELRGCADGFTQYTADHPKGLETTSLSAGGTICGVTDPVRAQLTLQAFKENDIGKRTEIASKFWQRQYETWQFPSVVETLDWVWYNPKKIASWDRPLEIGVGGAEIIALETIVLK